MNIEKGCSGGGLYLKLKPRKTGLPNHMALIGTIVLASKDNKNIIDEASGIIYSRPLGVTHTQKVYFNEFK